MMAVVALCSWIWLLYDSIHINGYNITNNMHNIYTQISLLYNPTIIAAALWTGNK
jgi:hypothetical protein